MKILYEDNHCIAVVKPHGILSQADAGEDASLLDLVKEYLRTTYHKPGEAFIGLVHRLDRPVGGIMLFAKTSKGASRLSEQIRNHRFQKTYWALVEGTPVQSEGMVIEWLKKDPATNTVQAYQHETKDTLRAELAYRMLSSKGNRTLIEVTPKTGRPHQIRSAMRALGTPIVGDLKYGSRTKLGNAIGLFARSLTFEKPVGGESITVTADPDSTSPLYPYLTS